MPAVAREPRQSLRDLLPAILSLFLLAVVPYLPVLDNDLLNWDDPAYVTENSLIRQLDPSGLARIFSTTLNGNYHPLTLVSLAGFRSFPPLNIRSVSLPALITLELLGPSTNRMASAMFDLPAPFGPVTAV